MRGAEQDPDFPSSPFLRGPLLTCLPAYPKDDVSVANLRFPPPPIGFSDSAEEIWFSVEGDGPVGILRAKLRTQDGELVDRDLNLSERLGNNDGNFNWC